MEKAVVWHFPGDLRREVMLPPGHFLLVTGKDPFRASITENDTTMAVEESLTDAGDHPFVLFRPLPVAGEIEMLLDELAAFQQSLEDRADGRDGSPALRARCQVINQLIQDWLAEERREAEGRVVAEAISGAVRDGRCRYRDVHILFRAFSSISSYLRPLRERGIPFVVDGGREFLERPEVRQLMAALRALALPGDEPDPRSGTDRPASPRRRRGPPAHRT